MCIVCVSGMCTIYIYVIYIYSHAVCVFVTTKLVANISLYHSPFLLIEATSLIEPRVHQSCWLDSLPWGWGFPSLPSECWVIATYLLCFQVASGDLVHPFNAVQQPLYPLRHLLTTHFILYSSLTTMPLTKFSCH